MNTWIALLRGVNVGGNALVAMSDLRTLASSLGLKKPRTLLQSGNLVFHAEGEEAALERRLEAAIAKRFDVAADVVLRTAAEWDEIVAGNPYPVAAEEDPGHLLAMSLKNPPEAEAVAALAAAIVGRETVEARGRTLYLVYPDGVGRSKLTNVLIERRLGLRGTARNWNTVLKLAELAKA